MITFLRRGSQSTLPTSLFPSTRSLLPCFLGLKWSRLDKSSPWRKRFTSLSSSEWKVITQRRPPGVSAERAARSPAWSSFSSSFTKIRRAWKVLVATCAGLWSRSLRAWTTAAGKDPRGKEMGRVSGWCPDAQSKRDSRITATTSHVAVYLHVCPKCHYFSISYLCEDAKMGLWSYSWLVNSNQFYLECKYSSGSWDFVQEML